MVPLSQRSVGKFTLYLLDSICPRDRHTEILQCCAHPTKLVRTWEWPLGAFCRGSEPMQVLCRRVSLWIKTSIKMDTPFTFKLFDRSLSVKTLYFKAFWLEALLTQNFGLLAVICLHLGKCFCGLVLFIFSMLEQEVWLFVAFSQPIPLERKLFSSFAWR